MNTSDNKNPMKETGKYVRSTEHDKIKAIAGELLAEPGALDLSQPGKL